MLTLLKEKTTRRNLARWIFFRYHEAVKLARDPDVQNEELTKTFQRSYAGARKVRSCSKTYQRWILTGLFTPKGYCIHDERVQRSHFDPLGAGGQAIAASFQYGTAPKRYKMCTWHIPTEYGCTCKIRGKGD